MGFSRDAKLQKALTIYRPVSSIQKAPATAFNGGFLYPRSPLTYTASAPFCQAPISSQPAIYDRCGLDHIVHTQIRRGYSFGGLVSMTQSQARPKVKFRYILFGCGWAVVLVWRPIKISLGLKIQSLCFLFFARISRISIWGIFEFLYIVELLDAHSQKEWNS